MSYTISGNTISVSGTVNLTHTTLPPISRIEFEPGGATVTFSSSTFIGIPPQGANYAVVGSAAKDVLVISAQGIWPPGFGYLIDLTFFSFSNWGANDVVIVNGSSDANNIWGSYRSEIINGDAGNDFIHSGSADGTPSDTLRGGSGDDTYTVHPNDIVDETGTGGIDTIESYWSYSLLSSNVRGAVENVTLIAVDQNADATGNALDNKLVGGLRDNVLNGLGGDDYMQGRLGNDTYVVNSRNDTVDEKLNMPGGIDTVRASISYSLSDTVHALGALENLVLIGSALDGEGNGLSNALTGNGLANSLAGRAGNDVLDGEGGADVLSGQSGADQLVGGDGNDTYVLGTEAAGVDRVVDLQGIDTITSFVNRNLSFADYSEIENLTLLGNAVAGIGNALSNILTGNNRANALHGLDGNDTLVGGLGADRLRGGLGWDKFVFNTVTESRVAGGRDVIVDFQHAQHDRIVLSNIDANTQAAGNQAFHFIATAEFSHHAGELRYHKADGHSFIEGDVNGDGVADLAIISDLPVNFVGSDFAL